MFIKLFSYFFFNKNEKKISFYNNIIENINFLEKKFSAYSDNKIKNNTILFRKLLLLNNDINILLPKIFANIYEAIKRVLGIKLFNVQLLGALSLYDGNIIEMKTGEGKTITATLPAYLYSILGKSVHIITINDYLAKRDWLNNSKIFEFLGLKTGLNLSGMSILEKKKAYLSDITYGTSSEFVFDYLRDNMILCKKDKVQLKKLYYVILDEIDSILIDEARTPLIISEPNDNDLNLYNYINEIVLKLNYKKDFIVNIKNNQVYLTDKGILNVEKLLIENNIINKEEIFYSFKNINIMHNVISSLKANYLYKKNVDYLVYNNEIIIIDENTGRMVPDRRWSDGLHQAIEAKEKVKIKNENKILASITFQNYFKLYKKISGMTGTAVTESSEFNIIYGLDTIIIPTNKIMRRRDKDDVIFLSNKEKEKAIIDDIKFRYNKKQPVLIGTTSIEKSEYLSSKLHKLNIKHNVLNAKYHAEEANIISQAGKLGSVTISTNMAGRGTDIILGGNLLNDFINIKKKNNIKLNLIKKKWKKNHDLVISLGGLYIIGTEKYESRRLNDQLRGRSGRQGDPGSSIFYISLDDDLMKLFCPKGMVYFMRKLGIKYGECIQHPWLTYCIKNAQKKIESRNFYIRKQLLEYDNIYNNQRKIFYLKRNKILNTKNIFLEIRFIIKSFVRKLIYLNFYNNYLFNKCLNNLNLYNLNLFFNEYNYIKICFFLFKKVVCIYNNKCFFNKKKIAILYKNIILITLDFFWKEYLYVADNLKENINLYFYAQRDPKQEYKIKSFYIFDKLINNFYYEVIRIFLNLPKDCNKIFKIMNIYNVCF